MSYVDNASLITAWDTRVQALKDIIATLTDGSTTKVVIEDTSEANVLLSSMSAGSDVLSLGGLEVVSNEQAPIVTLEAPQLVVEPEEDSDDESDQEEEKDDTVDGTVEEPSDQEDETEEEEAENE